MPREILVTSCYDCVLSAHHPNISEYFRCRLLGPVHVVLPGPRHNARLPYDCPLKENALVLKAVAKELKDE